MPVTIRDIASRLNVSHTTVSRVLNGRGAEFISESTRQRVREMAVELRYTPNRAARALATGQTRMIALWSPGVTYPYFISAVRHAEQQLRASGYDLVIRSTSGGLDEHRALLELPVDGILAMDGPDVLRAVMARHEASCPPIVSMGPYYLDSLDHVGIDLGGGAREAVNHLIASGRRRIAYAVCEWGHHAGDARWRAYHETVREAGLTPELCVHPHNNRANARHTIVEYVREHGCPDALFCFSDDTAIGTYRGLCDLGVRVPEDVLLVGCDGIEDTEYLECPLSTIVQPYEEMCALAWDYLRQRMQNPTLSAQQTVLPSRLVVRRSSQP